MPFQVDHVWSWFWEICRRRRKGPEAFTHADILAWAEATQTDINPQEIQMITDMDDVWMATTSAEIAAYHERQRAKSATKTPRKR